MDKRGEGGRAGAEIGGKARSPDPYVARGPPDAVNSGPPLPEAGRTRPACPPSGITPERESLGSSGRVSLDLGARWRGAEEAKEEKGEKEPGSRQPPP